MTKLAKLFVFAITLFVTLSTWAQTDNSANIGFDNGSISGWTLSGGTLRRTNAGDVIIDPEQPRSLGQYFEITSNSGGNDPKITTEQIPKTYKNSVNSIRIGNIVDGGTYQKIKTSFLVTQTKNLFQYHFAILLQNNSSHSTAQKPSFTINIKNASGTNITCGDFNIQLESTLANGFKKQGDIEFRNWTTGSIDLRQYLGQQLTVEVTVQGCAGRQHFGYAYFDAELLKTEIKTASNCPAPDGSMVFLAPEGFEKYTWDNGNTQQAATYKPQANQTVNVTLVPYSSLNAACGVNLTYKVPYKNISSQQVSNICEGEKFMIDGRAYNSTGVFSQTISRFGVCDSTVFLNQIVTPLARLSMGSTLCNTETLKIRDTTISTSGNYKVTIKRPGKCDSIVTANVSIEKFKLLTPPNRKLVEDEELILDAKTSEGSLGDFTWTWGSESCRNCPGKSLFPTQDGTYFLQAKSASGICEQKASFKLNIIPCGFFIPTAFSPNNDNINDVFKIEGGKCIQEIQKFAVYNRWGEELHLKQNFKLKDTANFWEGKNANKFSLAPTGLYFYTINGTTSKGKPLSKKGSVLLLE